MESVLTWIDETAAVSRHNSLATWLERSAFIFLLLMAVAAPHSIAITQGAWVGGFLVWVIRHFFKPRPKVKVTALGFALLAFFGWSVVSAIFSYAPDISFSKLRSVSLLFIFLFVINTVRTRAAAFTVVAVLIASCMVNVVWTPIERSMGRGVEIHGVRANGPLGKAKLQDGDTIVEINGKNAIDPKFLFAEIAANEVSKVKMYRPDFYLVLDVQRSDLLAVMIPETEKDAMEKLGITGWKKSRNWRSSGFYGHYTTYAEVLQLLGSIVLGLFIALPWKRSKMGVGLVICAGLMAMALLLTVTRASQAAFLLSAFAMVFFGASRRAFWILLAGAIPLALVGLFFLQQSRQVGFLDQKDNSITWRQTVYKEAIDLATASPRHMAVGVGMDSIKRYAGEWHLFDDGKLPMGHFHSTPLQVAVERGIPALLIWLGVVLIYFRKLHRGVAENLTNDWRERGILLGCLGGLIGFFVSGMVHYNLGDGEVAMIFYLLMGIGSYVVDTSEAQFA
jgi:hypothetical protein